MTKAFQKVQRAALSLSESERKLLAAKLRASLEDGAKNDESLKLSKEWEDEIERRVDELESGKAKTISAKEVFRKLDARQRR